MLDGVVRDLTATFGVHEVLTNVTKFNTVCGAGSSRSSVSKGAIAGIDYYCFEMCSSCSACNLHGSCQTL